MKWQKKFLRNWNQTLQKKIKVLYIIPPDFIWNLQISFFSPYSTLSLWQEGGFVDMMSCVNEPSSAPPYFNFSQEKTRSTVLLTILAFPRRLFLPPLSNSFVMSLGIITSFLTLLPVFYKDDALIPIWTLLPNSASSCGCIWFGFITIQSDCEIVKLWSFLNCPEGK